MAWSPEDEWEEEQYWKERYKQHREEGGELRRWYLQRVAEELGEGRPFAQTYSGFSPSHREALLEWFWQERDRFLAWKPNGEYAGPGFASGHWVVNRKAVVGAASLAIWSTVLGGRRALDHYLEKLLDIDPGFPVPVEPRGERLLTFTEQWDAAHRLDEAQQRCRRRWPRTCIDCRGSFKPTSTAHIRCKDCRAKQRAAKSLRRANRGT